MQKIFTYLETIMNGTITVKSSVAAFTDRALAERARNAVVEINGKNRDGGLRLVCSDIHETDVYECDGEILILSETFQK